jgi:hypothetical protein
LATSSNTDFNSASIISIQAHAFSSVRGKGGPMSRSCLLRSDVNRLVLRNELQGSMLRWPHRASDASPGGPRQCPAPLAELGAVFGNRSKSVLLLVIRYHGGSDVCWEPDETFHALQMGR